MRDIMELTVPIAVIVMRPARVMETVRNGEVVFVIQAMLDIDVVIFVILILAVAAMANVALQVNASVILAIMETNVSINALEMATALEIPVNVIHVLLVLTVTQNAQDMDSVRTQNAYAQQLGKEPTVKYQDAPMTALEMVYVMVSYKNVIVILAGKVLIVVSPTVLASLIVMRGVSVVFTMALLPVATAVKVGWEQLVMMYVSTVYNHQWIVGTASVTLAGQGKDVTLFVWLTDNVLLKSVIVTH